MEAVDKIRDTAASHTRAFLVQTMGRECGYLAVQSAMISGAEMALIPEDPVSVEEIAQTVENAYKRGKRHCIIIMAEGYPIPMVDLAKQLDEMDLGFTTRSINLSYVQRGGSPTSFDRILASRMGYAAVELISSGQTSLMTAMQGREIIGLPLADIVGKHRPISEEYLHISNILSR
jgi:6-phosphofructokinase 1